MKGRDEIRPTLSFILLTGGKVREVTLQYNAVLSEQAWQPQSNRICNVTLQALLTACSEKSKMYKQLWEIVHEIVIKLRPAVTLAEKYAAPDTIPTTTRLAGTFANIWNGTCMGRIYYIIQSIFAATVHIKLKKNAWKVSCSIFD